MKEILIFGAGDIARLAYFYFKTDSQYEVKAFVVDRKYMPPERKLMGIDILPLEEVYEKYSPTQVSFFVALSYAKMNKIRAKKYFEIKEKGYELVSYISSKCTYLSEHKHGDNCFILENNTIQPFAKIGNNVTLWSGNHIGHDSVIEDHCFITSHVVVSGNVRVMNSCFIGVNATLRNSITLAPSTLIGAGAIIMKNTKEKEVYLPERAKLFEKLSDEIEL